MGLSNQSHYWFDVLIIRPGQKGAWNCLFLSNYWLAETLLCEHDASIEFTVT